MQAELRDIGGASRPSSAVRSRAPGSASGSPTAGATSTYPNQKLDAASLVYTKAPQIIRAFDEGALILLRPTVS